MIMYAKIRRMFYREYLSNNEIQRRTSLSRSTIKKWLRAPSDGAVKYQRAKKPVKLTPFESRLLLVLEARGVELFRVDFGCGVESVPRGVECPDAEAECRAAAAWVRQGLARAQEDAAGVRRIS